ncbi:MAG: hypothetical protein IPK85_04055 [Gemmatimonadetes bacterium]|nr:hypothetical protein [Gemmatimonadota bacterium]
MNIIADMSFSSGSSDLANYTRIPPKEGQRPGRRIGLALFAQTTGNATAAGVIELALASRTRVYKREQATVTPFGTARRANHGGASGDYIMQLAFEVSGNHKIDVAGEGYDDGQDDISWYVGMPTLPTNGTALKVQVAEITEI